MKCLPIEEIPENAIKCKFSWFSAHAGVVFCLVSDYHKLLGHDGKCIDCPIVEMPDIEAMQKVVDAAREIYYDAYDFEPHKDDCTCPRCGFGKALAEYDAKEVKE